MGDGPTELPYCESVRRAETVDTKDGMPTRWTSCVSLAGVRSTISPVLRWQRDLRHQTDKLCRCTSGLARASASRHQLSIRCLSADPIAAGHRALPAPDCQVAMIAVTSSSISGGADLQLLRQWR